MKRHIPNFLTCCNLLSGTFGIVFLLEDRAIPTAWFVWISCVFDFFDGFAARWLKVSSPIGKELDSLADMVSFGLLPALVMYNMLGSATDIEFLPYAGFLIAVFSALRLAIFNVDETQRDTFKGLNTPANTLFITSLPLVAAAGYDWITNIWLLLAITVVFSLLLVSRIEIFALKFKSFRWAENKIRFIFLLISAGLLVVFQQLAIPLIILLYIGMSFTANIFSR